MPMYINAMYIYLLLKYGLISSTDLCLIDAVHNIDNSKWSEMVIPSMIVNLLKI